MSEQPAPIPLSRLCPWEGLAAAGVTYTGCLVAFTQAWSGDESVPARALALGAATWVFTLASARLGGALGNPAILVGMVLSGTTGCLRALPLLAAQLIGSVVGTIAARAVIPSGVLYLAHGGRPIPHPDLGDWQLVVVEFQLGFLLQFALIASQTGDRDGNETMNPQRLSAAAALATALFVVVSHRLSGGIANPALAFGPALASGVWDAQSAYWLGPVLGVVAFVIGRNLWNRSPAST